MASYRTLPSGKVQALVKKSGRSWYRSGPTKASVKRWVDQLERDLAAGLDPDRHSTMPTVGEWSKRWMAARVAEPTTLTGDTSRIATHILPRWEKVPLDEVSPLDVQSWVRQLSKKLAADTVRKVHSLLGQMCDDAVKERLIPVSPCVHTDLPTVPPGRELWLTEEQVAAIAASAADLTETSLGSTLIWTLYLTGARWGEATGLRVQDLDFLRRRIRIAQVNTRQGMKAYPKGRRNRTVPMPGQLADILAVHLASPNHTHNEGSPGSRRLASAQSDDGPSSSGTRVQPRPQRTSSQENRSALVFANARGGPISDANFRHRIWKPALEAAGLAQLNPRIHDLRHSAASRLVQAGVPMSDIAAYLGHSSVLVSARYAHLGEGRHDRVLEVLDTPTRLGRTSDS